MEYVAFVFAIFGFMAYFQISALKRKVENLEEQLTKIQGTPASLDRSALTSAIKTYVGQKVRIDLKEDHEDADIVMYGNSKHGSNTILDVDDDWFLVRISSPKGDKTKMIRLSSVERISLVKE